ncbi:YciI family protein [Deinococcus hopiensis]|uniref:YCII-related domain-containing protein n=1 Tax=Deinococcus hopiensis KR-140 TaxID=695939 RepID=A0A1W1UTL4_9DEIO|nr:YciI family protein [Deinococcus hopiensis]SMB84396.1 YCII-related domain-containing protein [Deinococcus hopiensis KR-140]
MSQHFVIHYVPGPAWLPNHPVFEQPLQPHLAYITQLHHQGVVLAGGPYTDNSGGLVILQPTTREAAQMVILNDPAIIPGIMTASANPWYSVFNGLPQAVNAKRRLGLEAGVAE